MNTSPPSRRSALRWSAGAAAALTAAPALTALRPDRRNDGADIHVEMQTIPQNVQGGYQKMHASLTAGNPPDLAQVEYHELPGFMLVNGLTDLSAYGADELRDSYVPWQWNQGVFGGRVRTIPQASGPMGLFYRQDLFEKWGIETPAT